MRQSLNTLINQTILYKYSLPTAIPKIDSATLSTKPDECYEVKCNTDFATIIYNSLIEYSFSEHELQSKDYQSLLSRALIARLKYNKDATESQKISYGFLGETVLCTFLHAIYGIKAAISRGYFYNPLENSETKGYDSYHLIDNGSGVELWFGEVKFYLGFKAALDNAMSNIGKALSDDYFSKNIYAISNFRTNLNLTGTRLEPILDAWEASPDVCPVAEIKKHNMKLCYPVMIIYGDDNKYDASIIDAIKTINENYPSLGSSISFNFDIYFILIPLTEARIIKKQVIDWIEAKHSLLP